MAVNCQHCGVKLFGDEVLAGACEHCQVRPTTRPAPQTLAPAWVAGRRPRLADRDTAWRWARVGTQMLFWGAVANLVSLLALVAGIVARLGEAGRDAALVLGMAMVATALLGALLTLVGGLLCCLVPRHSRLQGRAIVSAVSTITLVVTGAAMFGLLVQSRGLQVGQQWAPTSLAVAGLAGLVLLAVTATLAHFILLAGVAQAMGDDGLGTRFLLYPFVTFGVAFAVTIGLVLAANILSQGALAGVVLPFLQFLLSFLFTLYLLGMYRDLHELLSPPDAL